MEHFRAQTDERDWGYLLLSVTAYIGFFFGITFIAPHISQETRDLRRMGAPLNQEGTAWDVASAAAFLASDDSRWITGATLPVDGGLLATQSLSLVERFRGSSDE